MSAAKGPRSSEGRGGGSITIPVVQLPVDLQNEIRNGGGSIASGAFVGGARDFLMMLLLLIAAAAFAYGFASAFSNLHGPFHAPGRLLVLVGGAATVGVFLGLHARLDIRPHNISRWIVGPTSLVRVGRDVIEVYPAEDIVYDGVNVSFRGALLERGYHVPTEELAAAATASKDPDLRASDRWRAAAVGRPAPVWRWAPVAHGAGLALALAVAVEAGIPTSGGSDRWSGLEDRADELAQKMPAYDKQIAQQRVDLAATNGFGALEQLVHTARNSSNGDKQLEMLAEQRREKMIEEQLPTASLDDMFQWFVTNQRDLPLPDDLLAKIRVQFETVLRVQFQTIELRALIGYAEEAKQMRAGRDEALAWIDTQLAAQIKATSNGVFEDSTLAQLEGWTSQLEVDKGRLPEAYKAAAIAAARYAATAKTIEEVYAVDEYLPEPTKKALYTAAYQRELATATIETIGALASEVERYNVGSLDDVHARGRALLNSSLANARTSEQLDKIAEGSYALPGDHQVVIDRITARGKELAYSTGVLAEQIKWITWLGDEELTRPLRARVAAASKSGDLASLREIAMNYDDSDVRDAAQGKLDTQCDKQFPVDKRGKDLARWLAASYCGAIEPTIGISAYDPEGTPEMTQQLAARTQALLANAGVPRTLKVQVDVTSAVNLYVRAMADGLTVQPSGVDGYTDFHCKAVGGRWSCTLDE